MQGVFVFVQVLNKRNNPAAKLKDIFLIAALVGKLDLQALI